MVRDFFSTGKKAPAHFCKKYGTIDSMLLKYNKTLTYIVIFLENDDFVSYKQKSSSAFFQKILPFSLNVSILLK